MNRRRFLRRSLTAAAGAAIGFGFGRRPGFGYSRGAAGEVKKNVILIITDTVRADRLGCYGNTEGITPGIDRFARDGVLFENCYSQAPWTLPAVASILTSAYPDRHGAGGPEGRFTRLRGDIPTVAEVFAGAGYATGAVTNVRFLSETFGLNRGFGSVDVYKTKNVYRHARRAMRTSFAALRWIQRHKAKPFFLLVHYYDPHLIYAPPSAFRRRFAEVQDRSTGNYIFGTGTDILNMRTSGTCPDRKTIGRLKKLYNGEVAYTDSAVGWLLERISDVGLGGKTVIALMSDHGEEFLDHGGFEHSHTLYDELLKVPLIIRTPGMLEKQAEHRPGTAGIRVGPDVRSIDVAPTLCGLVGISAAKGFVGESLVSLEGRGGADRPVLSQETMWGVNKNALRRDGFKIIVKSSPAKYELYDIKKDPGEQNNIASKNSVRCGKMAAEVDGMIEAAGGRQLLRQKAAISEEDINALRSLGYVK